MVKMEKYELTVEYSTKGSDTVNKKIINIDLQEYQNSYKNEMSNLEQQYTRSEINKQVRSTKEQFIFDCISKNLSDNQEMVSLINPLVDEIDEFVTESNKQFS
jgi:hypothetical protein